MSTYVGTLVKSESARGLWLKEFSVLLVFYLTDTNFPDEQNGGDSVKNLASIAEAAKTGGMGEPPNQEGKVSANCQWIEIMAFLPASTQCAGLHLTLLFLFLLRLI